MKRTDEEADLVLRAREGSQSALTDLLTIYRARVLRFCIGRMGNVDAAEDATQETLVAMVGAVARFRGDPTKFSSFVFGIASNKVSMARRAGGRRAVLTNDVDVLDQANVEAPDRGDGRLSLLDGLPARQREILVLRLVEGMSADEVGALLGMSAGAVRVMQHRALATLRAHVAVKGGAR